MLEPIQIKDHYPNGITPIVKPMGATQVDEMRDRENRQDGLAAEAPPAGATSAENSG